MQFLRFYRRDCDVMRDTCMLYLRGVRIWLQSVTTPTACSCPNRGACMGHPNPVASPEAYCAPPTGPPPHLLLAKDPQAPRQAREFARQFVSYHVPGIDPDRLDATVLVVSELVTNSVRYGTEPGDAICLTMVASARGVRIEVADPVRRRPRLCEGGDERVRGRGLYLVAVLASRWGVESQPLGKSVWAELTWVR
ncbi:ATP-binding protein [Streptomyces sp. NPDC059740]|uniref:ATP-binding protein n=1 Tax=Streptomyces sp. NPDC059740 TaxID=3346926 RepID=UPI003657BF6C